MKKNKIGLGLKILLKKFLLIILAIFGNILLLPAWSRGKKNKLLVLRYHSVNDYRKHEVNVRINTFRKQMEFLARCYQPVSLKEAVEDLKEKRQLPDNAVVVTFDDGYKDNYTNVYPILKKLNIPATIFLVVGYVGTDKILPHDIGDCPENNYLLSWDQVKKMAQDGFDFGSHTTSHVNLGKCNIDLKNEISASKKIIERELERGVWAISYPFGLITDFSSAVKQMASEAGYSCGCSAMNGVNDSGTDIFELRRIGIEASDNMFTFRSKLNGALDLLILKDKPIFNKLLSIFNRLIGV